MSEPKIVPIGDEFENMQAMLACIAEDPDATGFCGVVFRKTGGEREMVVTAFEVTGAEAALAALMIQRSALGDDDDVL